LSKLRFVLFKHCEKPAEKTGFKIAIIGAGPAGLHAAGFLACRGHEVYVFDKLPEPGGLLIFGIPDRRVPKSRIRSSIQELEKLGVVFNTGVKVTGKKIVNEVGDFLAKSSIDIREIVTKFDAVLITTGAWKCRKLNIEGEDSRYVYTALDYIFNVRLRELGYRDTEPEVREPVVVIGAGRTAVDVVEELCLRGLKVYLVYRRRLQESRAYRELSSIISKYNVRVFELKQPTRILTSRGEVVGIELAKVMIDSQGNLRVLRDSETEIIECGTVIEAIGESSSPPFDEETARELNVELQDGRLKVDNNYQTSNPKIFAAGDVVLGPSSIGHATKTGLEAARALDRYLLSTYRR